MDHMVTLDFFFISYFLYFSFLLLFHLHFADHLHTYSHQQVITTYSQNNTVIKYFENTNTYKAIVTLILHVHLDPHNIKFLLLHEFLISLTTSTKKPLFNRLYKHISS